MKTVYDLTRDELNEIKGNLYWMDVIDVVMLVNTTVGLTNEESECIVDNICDSEFAEDIEDEVVYKLYDGVSFVSDDFFCNK